MDTRLRKHYYSKVFLIELASVRHDREKKNALYFYTHMKALIISNLSRCRYGGKFQIIHLNNL